jgi:acylphosphatase
MKARSPRLARKYRISGRVQGVGFRYFAERAARELGLCGYVRNRDDGSVEVYAIGDAPALDEFRARLAQGPRSARVTAVDESEEPLNARYRDFVIEGGW